jgi:alkanesulfonate monooxygenase SsuD/methylene tetrahydromethanopterin reductase-like flavin-dependent oxidoreductase (luciferase family)
MLIPQQAGDEFFPPLCRSNGTYWKRTRLVGMDRPQFNASTGSQGALLVGSPQQVIDKILYEHDLFGHTAF